MNSVVIVAAGQGTRMGAKGDKLLLELAGCPLIVHTWRRFDQAACIDEIIIVLRADQQPGYQALAQRYGFQKPYRFALGGTERQDSVWNGLAALSPECEIVAIQDGARPLVTESLIAATIQAAKETGAAVAGQKLTDTIKESLDGQHITRTIDRQRLWSVQTPQCFQVAVIRQALTHVRQHQLHVTDDTAACEFIGQPVRIVECQAPNPKATSPADLPYLDWLLRQGADQPGSLQNGTAPLLYNKSLAVSL